MQTTECSERLVPRFPARVVLVAPEDRLGSWYGDVAEELGWVSLHRGSILDLEVDAVVSPANSFGFMDGGLDALYSRRFGRGVQDALQRLIVAEHAGELLVGDACTVPTGDPAIPYLIAAPTMRVPMRLPPDTVAPYLAARAVLRVVERQHERTRSSGEQTITTVALPGLGTGIGGVPAAVCARQVRAALVWATGPIGLPRTWAEASLDHQLLYTNRPERLQQ